VRAGNLLACVSAGNSSGRLVLVLICGGVQTANDFKNYKGWYSISNLAFVTGHYTFADFEVGYAGRTGDVSILRASDFYRRLKQVRSRFAA
jgi:hypothetical protein